MKITQTRKKININFFYDIGQDVDGDNPLNLKVL